MNITKLLCSIGIHEWQDSFVSTKHGFRWGDRCIHCHIWRSNTKPIPYTGDEDG